MYPVSRVLAGLLSCLAGLGGPISAAAAKAAAPVAHFTDTQVAAGQKNYQMFCASCHGQTLQGGAGIPLSGPAFLQHWADGAHSPGDLFFIVRSLMPLPKPGILKDEEYRTIVAYVLSRNGYAPGPAALTDASMDTNLPALAVAGKENEVGRPAFFPAPPSSVAKASTGKPDDADLLADDDADWLMYNKGYDGQRYSKLARINAGNAGGLQPVCAFQTGETGNFETSPVVYDGVMYITTAWNTYAIDAGDCRKIWESHATGVSDSPVIVTRGLAIYKGKLFRSTPDGHLLALDARTGAVLWDSWISDPSKGYWLSAAPVAYDGKVFMGEAGADWGVTAHIHAFDAETGSRVWTFDVIPTGGQTGADTWKRGAEHGGGSIWSTFSISPQDGLLFAPIGNAAPDMDGEARPGDNLFTDSVLALDVNTGKLAWYAQQLPHDTHDWDTAAAPTLFELDGRKYMAAVNKGGWLYLYDRQSHALLAQSEISPHLNDGSPITKEGVHVCPGIGGGAQWNGPAFSPEARMLFVDSQDWCSTYKLTATRYILGSVYYAGSYSWDPPETAKGWIRGFDAVTGKEIWRQQTRLPMVAGLTATAGGVLLTGDLSGDFQVLDARDGRTLYRFNTGGAIAGGVSTYLVKGRQYAATTSGHTSGTMWPTKGAATMFVFALPEK